MMQLLAGLDNIDDVIEDLVDNELMGHANSDGFADHIDRFLVDIACAKLALRLSIVHTCPTNADDPAPVAVHIRRVGI